MMAACRAVVFYQLQFMEHHEIISRKLAKISVASKNSGGSDKFFTFSR